MSNCLAYYAKETEENVTIMTGLHHELTITTDRDAYGISDGSATIALSLTNDNLYDVTYTISFNNTNLTYEIDGSTNLTYTIEAGTSKTHSIQISETDLTSLDISVDTTLPYSDDYTKTITLDQTAPICTFGSWSSDSIITDEHATVLLTCSDTSGIANTSLGSSAFSVSNGQVLNIESVTIGGSETERTFTITVAALSESGEASITLLENTIFDNNGNANEIVTSSNIEVIADVTAPIIEFTPLGNVEAAKTQSTVVNVTDFSEITAMKYLWTQTDGTSAENGAEFESGDTITKDSGDGTWYLCVYAEDVWGYSRNECSEAFVLDNTPPDLTVLDSIFVKKGSTEELASFISAIDAISEIDTIKAYINDVEYVNASSLASDKYSMTYTVTDKAGNSASKDTTLVVYVDMQDKCEVVTTTEADEGLYKDLTDTTRCIYRGGTSDVVNNWVKFPTDQTMWRIIGVESDGAVKIVKSTRYGSTTYQFHSNNTSVSFGGSTVKTLLNGTIWTSISETDRAFLTSHSFNIGAITYGSSSTATLATTYTNEKASTGTYSMGLPTATDYVKASTSCTSTSQWNSTCPKTADHNWMYRTDIVYWIINIYSETRARRVDSGVGGFGVGYLYATDKHSVLPVTHFKSTVVYTGSGTEEDPYIPIEIPNSSTTCAITTTTGYETSKELTIATSDDSSLHTTLPYSFDYVTWGPTNTKTIQAAGTYFGYIQDVNSRTNSCSIKIVSRKEYRRQKCTCVCNGWSFSSQAIVGIEGCDGLRSKEAAEAGGYTQYQVCHTYAGGSSGCIAAVGESECYVLSTYTRSCWRDDPCGSFTAWGTTEYSSTCTYKAESRTTYAPDSSSLAYKNLTIATDNSSYGGCDRSQTMSLSITNSNSYAVTYTLGFDNTDLTYTVDGNALTSYTIAANSTVTHSVLMSGATSGTSLKIDVNVTAPYSIVHTKSVALNYSCLSCSFGNWSDSSISTDETATITLSCTDNLTIPVETLTSSSFTLSNADILNIESITTSGTETAKDYTITVRGGTEAGSSTITLLDGSVFNENGLANEDITSANSIEVALKKYMVTYNGNKFSTLSSTTLAGVAVTYDPDTSELTLNGTPTGTLSLLTFAEEMNLNAKYNLSLEYVSGSYTSNTTMSFGVDVVTSASGGHTSTRLYSSVTLPTSGIISDELTIDQIGVDEGYGFHTWLWMSSPSDVTFVNYKVKVNLTKVEQIEVTYKKTYGTLGATPTRLGYTFDGWYTEETGGTEVTADTQVTATSDHTLYAHWTANSYTVTLTKGTGISEVSGAGTYNYGASVTIDATVSSGYTWSNWSGTHSTTTKQYTFTMPANDVSDTANATAAAAPTVTITISGETYSDGYKSGAVVTGTCDGPGGITAFSFEDNTGDTGTLATDTTTKKVNNITLSSANANRQVTISCTANGLTSTQTETYKIYVYGSSSVCGSATYSGTCSCNSGTTRVLSLIHI